VNAYVDSSVLLRILLGQENALKEWSRIDTGVASALVEVECLRTLDRLRVAARVSEGDLGRRREAVYRLMESLVVVDPSRPVLVRASQPYPTALGTLDAIHLATALQWRERTGEDLWMATHDAALGLAARASGMSVMGA
jgi:predicted nucleic acid-binding protein